MRSRQITERLGVEEAHMMEFQQFNAIWDKKVSLHLCTCVSCSSVGHHQMEEFKANAKQLVDNMKKKHSNELFRFKEKLQKSQVSTTTPQHLIHSTPQLSLVPPLLST